LSDADAEAEFMTVLAPFVRKLRDIGAHCQWAQNFPRMWASNFP
jgi:hypothetical protein